MAKKERGSRVHSPRSLSKRTFLKATASLATVAVTSTANAQGRDTVYDVIIVGAGNAGLPAALWSAKRGGKVLMIEASAQLGGTLLLSTGQMAAAGTKLQKSKGIEDTPQLHYDDVMRISHGTANPGLVKLATEGNGATFDWLMDHGLQVGPNHPELGTTHEPYSQRRYAWSPEKGGRAILEILEKELKPEIDKGNVKVLFRTEVTDLISEKGAVVGVVAQGEDKSVSRHRGLNVILTCGGYVSNAKLFEHFEGMPKYNDSSYPYSQGIGVKLATSVGGYIRGGEMQAPQFGGILEDADYPSPMIQAFRPWPADRPTWEIWVNADGQRFVAEDVLSRDAVEAALRKLPRTRAWIVFDQEAFDKAPQILNTEHYTRDDYAAMFNKHAFFFKADTCDGLAQKAGVNPKNFVDTVAAYNAAQKSGTDKLGRKYMPAAIAKPPYYAILVHGWSYLSFGGVAIDDQLRVIKQDGKPIPGLYAAGEVIGAGQTMGKSHCGGMCVTPALTFGRLLGDRMLKFRT